MYNDNVPSSYHSNFGRALSATLEYYGEGVKSYPPEVISTLVADVLEIWQRQGITFRGAVHELNRRIGGDLPSYCNAIASCNAALSDVLPEDN
jgi:hypothetical protein